MMRRTGMRVTAGLGKDDKCLKLASRCEATVVLWIRNWALETITRFHSLPRPENILHSSPNGFCRVECR